MSISTDGTFFIIDSSNAVNVSNPTNPFQYLMNMPKGNNYDRVVLLQAMIPKSYYLVDAPYNTMILQEKGVNTTITIVPGNYNALSWQTIIGTLLTANSPNGWTYTITFPNSLTQVDTGKFTYTVTGSGGFQPSFIFLNKNASTVYEPFGFAQASTNIFVGGVLISTNVVKFQQEDILYIHSNISSNNDQSATNDVLQEIYASTTISYSNVVYQLQGTIESYSKRLNNNANNIYTFSITNENENIMNLNGLNCAFTLLCYNKDNLSERVNKFFARTIMKYRQDDKIQMLKLQDYEKIMQSLQQQQSIQEEPEQIEEPINIENNPNENQDLSESNI